MTTLKELEEALIEYLYDNAESVIRDIDSAAYFVQEFIELNVEGNTDLINSVIDNDLIVSPTYQIDNFDCKPSRKHLCSHEKMLDFASAAISTALYRKASEWYQKWEAVDLTNTLKELEAKLIKTLEGSKRQILQSHDIDDQLNALNLVMKEPIAELTEEMPELASRLSRAAIHWLHELYFERG